MVPHHSPWVVWLGRNGAVWVEGWRVCFPKTHVKLHHGAVTVVLPVRERVSVGWRAMFMPGAHTFIGQNALNYAV